MCTQSGISILSSFLLEPVTAGAL